MSNDEALDHVQDAQGNLFVTGYYSYEGYFGTQNLLSQGSTDVFVSKVDQNGDHIWTVGMGGVLPDAGVAICVLPDGGIGVVGYYTGSMTLGGFTLQSAAGSQDVFVTKLDATGNVLWARTGGGPDSDIPYAIATDAAGNIMITGAFKGTGVFGGSSMTSVFDPIAMQPSYDIFIVKYGPTGNVLWQKHGAAEFDDRGMALATDATGNIYMAGQLSDTIQFDQTYLNSMMNAGFVLKMDAFGNELWMRLMGGSLCVPRDLAIDSQGDFYLTGEYMGQLAWFSNPVVFASNPYLRKIFLAKMDQNGDPYWIRSLGSENAITASKVAVDANGAAYVTGDFRCSFTQMADSLDDGVFYSVGFRDSYVAKYHHTGTGEWIRHFGSNYDDRPGGISVRSVDRPVISGGHQGKLIFPGTASAFEFAYPESGPISGLNDPSTDYCSDGNYGSYIYLDNFGQRDIFIAEAIDLNRAPYDYFTRISGANCSRPYLDACINNCQDTLIACDEIWAVANPFTGLENPLGPLYNYLWSNGVTNDSTLLTTSQTLTLEVSRMDGCRANTDTVEVIVQQSPAPPGMTDSEGINIQQLPQTTNLFACYPDTFILSVDPVLPGLTYYWDYIGGQDGTIPITVTETGVYDVIAETSAGCTGTNSIKVEIDDFANNDTLPAHLLLFDANGDLVTGDTLSICKYDEFIAAVYDSSQLSGNGFIMPYMITYINASVGNPYIGGCLSPCDLQWECRCFEALESTWVTLTVQMVDPCFITYEFTRTFYLNVWPLEAEVSILPVGPLCPGDTTVITAVGTGTFAWSGPGLISAPGTNPALVNQPGQYYVVSTATNAQGCELSESDNITVESRPAPQVVLNPTNGIVCPNDSVMMSIPYGSGHVWYGPNGEVIGNGPTVYGTTPGPYFCEMIEPDGCALISDIVNLEEYTTPYIVAIPGTSICPGESVMLQVYCNDEALLSWNAPLSGSGQFITVNQPGTYTCSVTLCGFTATASIIITQNVLTANVLLNGPDTLCEGQTAIMTVSPLLGGVIWSDGSATTVTQITEGGSYWATMTTPEGCEVQTDTVTLSFLDAPDAPEPIDTLVCAGSGVSIALAPMPGLTYLYGPVGSAPSAVTVIEVTEVTGPMVGNLYTSNGTCPSLAAAVNLDIVPSSSPISIIGDSTLCPEAELSLALTDAALTQVQWLLPDGSTLNQAILNISGAEAGTYMATVSSSCGDLTDDILVSLLTSIPTEITAPQDTFCSTDQVMVSSVNGSEVTWLPSGVVGIEYAIEGAGPQQVWATTLDANGCSSTSDTLNLLGLDPPVTPAIPDQTVCSGQDLVLGVGSGTDHTWWWDGTGSPIDADSVQFAALTAGFTLHHQTLAGGCDGEVDTVLVNVIPLPVLSSLPDSVLLCPDDTLVLGVEGQPDLITTWTWPSGVTSVSDSISDALPQTGYYQVATSNQACETSDSIWVSVSPVIVVNIIQGPEVVACLGDPVELSTDVTEVATYLWAPGGENTAEIYPDTTGTYQLTVTTAQGCEFVSDITQVTFNPLPETPFVDADTTLCAGIDLLLTSAVSGDVSWWWESDPIDTGATVVLDSLVTGGVLTAQTTDPETGCVSAVATLTVATVTLPDPLEVTVSGSYCEGDMLTLSADLFSGLSYNWTGPQTFIATGATVQLGPLATAMDGTYQLAYSNGYCSDSLDVGPIEVIVRPEAPSLDGDTVVCVGDQIKIIATWSDGDLVWENPGLLIEQSDRLKHSSATVEMTGTYFAHLENEGCPGPQASMTVVVSAAPLLSLGDGHLLCPEEVVMLSVDSSLFVSAFWNGDSDGMTYTQTGPGIVTVEATSFGDCMVSDEVEFGELDCDPFPSNAITPNGDGINDVFSLITEGVIDQRANIYNRWGAKVAELDMSNPTWDGTNMFTKLKEEAGVYYYVADMVVQGGQAITRKNYLQLIW